LRDLSQERTVASEPEPDTDVLLAEAQAGNPTARGTLLERYRLRLRRMVAVRIDPRLAARLDPSDVVQETLAEAHRRLDDYLSDRPLPLYPWLRQIAQDRLADLHRRHVRAGRRAVDREQSPGPVLSDQSVAELAHRLVGSATGPSEMARRREQSGQLRQALLRLSETDREVLILRHLEHLSPKEIAAVLGVSESVVYTRHLRALERLRRELGGEGER
jgi:RNA polymerase sigma-70 factor (ECF subfamily)